MNLPEFIYFDTPALPGAGFILSTNFPYFIGKVYKFKTRNELDDFAARQQANNLFPIFSKPGIYTITIALYGAMEGYEIRSQKMADQVATIFKEMADFYLTEKIQPHAAAYKKYRED